MSDIKKWFQPETTKKAVYEGIYPVMITAAKNFTKESEKDNQTVNREVVAVTFKTLSEVPFPDKTSEKIVLEQNYYFDVPMHVNGLNGLARACGIQDLHDTDQLEGKTCIIGITNREFQTNDGDTKVVPQFGWGLFSYAPMSDKAQIEYIANEIDHKPSDDEYKEWFKKHLASYKAPK